MTETHAGPREGEKLRNFELPDDKGQPFNLYRRLRKEPLVLVFYRGDW